MESVHAVQPGWTGWPDDETVMCRCEEVTLGELRAAIDLGADDARSAKLLARPGMGWCQGRICGHAVSAIVAAAGGARTWPGTAGHGTPMPGWRPFPRARWPSPSRSGSWPRWPARTRRRTVRSHRVNVICHMSLEVMRCEPSPGTACWSPTPCPTHADLAVDFDRYAEHVAWLAASGCDGITPNGSLGEYQVLTPEERTRVVETAVAAAPDGILRHPRRGRVRGQGGRPLGRGRGQGRARAR